MSTAHQTTPAEADSAAHDKTAPADCVHPACSAEWEYLCVEVTRSESTDLYLKVPKGWRPSGRDHVMIGRAAKQTTTDSDWDNYGWEQDVEVQGYKPVEASEAEEYRIFDTLPLLPNALDQTPRTHDHE